jgi:hypothetical protein
MMKKVSFGLSKKKRNFLEIEKLEKFLTQGFNASDDPFKLT